VAREHGLEVCAFFDSRTELATCNGIPCFRPDSTEATDIARRAIPVVIAIFNYATDTRPIARFLAERGFERVLSYQEFHELYGQASDFWLTKRSYYQGRGSEVLEGFDLLGDDISRQVYHDCLAYRLTFDPELLSDPDPEHHYLPADLPPAGSPMRLVDCGAFTGDTVALFLQNGIQFEAVVAFEPDPLNYALLCSNLAPYMDQLGQSVLVPCGTGDQTTMAGFSAGAGAGSAIGTESIATIQVVALDDILAAFSPTFIKLDIEGAEPLALRGAGRTIQRSLPRLAVSVYHSPDHLWTIPKLIRELEPRYRLALRYHQRNGFDIVAYAFVE
jgi:FkbM family methyltransferase